MSILVGARMFMICLAHMCNDDIIPCTLRKLECSGYAYASNTLAWNSVKGLLRHYDG